VKSWAPTSSCSRRRRRLARVHLAGGKGKAAFPDDADKDPQTPDMHGSILPIIRKIFWFIRVLLFVQQGCLVPDSL
jgi:hypothetical protein